MARKKSVDDLEELIQAEDETPFIENPNSSVIKEEARRVIRNRRWAKFFVWVIVAFMAVVLMQMAVNSANNQKDASVSSLSINSTVGKPLAVDEMRLWLQSEPQPVQGGAVLSWNGVEVIPAPDPDSGGASSNPPTYDTEIHHFTVTDAAGNLYTGLATVESNPALGSRLVATPTLLPIAPSAADGTEWGSNTTWFGYNSTQPSGDLIKSVTAWSTAFTSGDPSDLRLAIGDGEASHSYMPLGFAEDTTVTVIAAGQKLEEGSNNEIADPSTMLVRVELRASLNGQDTSQISSIQLNSRVPMTFDLLVTDANTATPRVVSWGAIGSGPTLTPYSVSIDNRDIETMSSPSPSATVPTDGTAPTEGADGATPTDEAPTEDPAAPATEAPAVPEQPQPTPTP